MHVDDHIRHLVVVGRVQGVGFRYGMARKAAVLGIRGWVRNRRDGSVEAMVRGTPEAIAAIMAWSRHGPRGAAVDRVEVEPGEGEFAEFETRATE
jgi:acylphosphatase